MDRNDFPVVPAELTKLSLSARRAWIEIFCPAGCWRDARVALRKESVDRNLANCHIQNKLYVALRKESVDRNKPVGTIPKELICRSPQGERG